jgi:hypothetical protein
VQDTKVRLFCCECEGFRAIFVSNNFGPQCRKPSKYQPLTNYSMSLSENHATKKKHAFIVSKLPFDDHQIDFQVFIHDSWMKPAVDGQIWYFSPW